MRRRSEPRRPNRGIWLLLACAVALLPANLAAQSLEGQPIKEISFEGLQLLSTETLLFYLSLDLGAPYDSAELNRRIHSLWDRQLIDDISVDAEAADGGVLLTIRLRERPTLRSVEYLGLKRISKSDITDRTARDRIRVREGDPVNLGELYRLKSAIEDLYGEKGYRLAEANFVLEEASVTDRKVLYTIDEGDKVRVEDIDFEGNTVYRDLRLRWTMKETKESGLIMSMLKKDVYNPASLEADLDSVRDIYRKAGYKNVVLGEPKIEVKATKPNATDAEKQKRRLFITIPVEEGDRWRIGEITIEGNEAFSDEILMRQFKAPPGSWLKSSLIEQGLETLTELYSNTGHLYARVEPELVERENQVADLIVHVNEGDQFRVGKIEFQGNTKTKDKVIRREMGIQEGRVLNQGALKNSLLRLGQMEFFKVDEQDPVQFDFNDDENTVDLTIKGEEGDRTELLFGAGFSEIDGFFGQLQFKTRNFLGRGETLGVSLQSGSRQDVFDISYTIPWFMDRPQSLGLQAFKRRLRYSLLSGQSVFQDNQGGIVTYGRNLGLFKSISLSYSLFDQTDEREQFNLAGELVTQDFSRQISAIRVGYNMDKRDSRLQPTFGTRYNLSVDLAGGPLGGSTNYYRPAGTYTKYVPVTKGRLRTSAAFNVAMGLIEPYGGLPLSFNDRYYLGGENSVRGFSYRSIWVRDEDGLTVTDESGFPLGGERMMQFNLEYIFVVGGPFRVILFTDSGKVFLAEQDLNFDNMRTTYGAELQVNVPILGAPLRFIYSTRLNELPDDRFESFQFSIGPSF